MCQQSRILIVDDDPLSREVLETLVLRLGHIPVSAETGSAAFRGIDESRPDLILLDLMMPEMDGFEVLYLLGRRDDLKSIPVVVVTSTEDQEGLARCLENGAEDFVMKPLDMAVFNARVNRCLERKYLRDREELQRRELETKNERIREKNQALEEANERMERFMRIATHDLRSPLTSIMGFTSLYLDAPEYLDSRERLSRTFKSIEVAASHMWEIVNDFLDSQRLDNGELEARIESLDIDECVEESVTAMRSSAERKGVDIRIETSVASPRVAGDKERLRQVLSNFLSNAVKFSPVGTEVTVRTRREGANTRIEIEDQGPGVREDERVSLFREFPHISNEPTGDEKSFGFGLSIAKRLVELQRGKVGADFPLSGGSVFWFQLPSVNEVSEDVGGGSFSDCSEQAAAAQETSRVFSWRPTRKNRREGELSSFA